jgi:hypothetical protein
MANMSGRTSAPAKSSNKAAGGDASAMPGMTIDPMAGMDMSAMMAGQLGGYS